MMTNSSWFSWNFSDFSTGSPAFWNTSFWGKLGWLVTLFLVPIWVQLNQMAALVSLSFYLINWVKWEMIGGTHFVLVWFCGEGDVCVCVLVTQSCSTLCDPMHCSPPGFSAHEFSRQEYWSGVDTLFSRGSSWPRDWTRVSCIAGGFVTIWATKEAQRWWQLANCYRDIDFFF